MTPDSREQHKLFDYIQRTSDQGLIIGEITSHYKQQQDLSWFQDIIPELVPGVGANADVPLWVVEARSLLWTVDLEREHTKICERQRQLRRPNPAPKSCDRFNLQQYWPLCVSSLSPMSPGMAQAVGAVSQLLLRRDVGDRKKHDLHAVTSTNSADCLSILSQQVVQDKILSPIIKALGEDTESLEAQLSVLDIELRKLTCKDALSDAIVVTVAQLRQRKGELTAQIREDTQLRNTLKDLWGVIVREKGLETSTPKKRRLHSSISDTDYNGAKRHSSDLS